MTSLRVHFFEESSKKHLLLNLNIHNARIFIPIKILLIFISMNMIDFFQLISVFFGTLIAAPLIVSKKIKKRFIGLLAITIGCFFAIIVQIYLGLYYFVFANVFWLLNALNGMKKISKRKGKI